MSTALNLPPRDMTVDEFFDWAETVDGRWQLRDGEPEMMSPGSLTHGVIQANLTALLVPHLRARGDGCRAMITPGVTPRLRSDRNMRVPDIGVTCTPRQEGRAMAEPRLLVEILSPSNARQTWANVWAYATIPSLAEILIVSSTACAADLLRRRPDGSWPEKADRIAGSDMLELRSVGLSVPLSEVYRDTPFGPP